MAQLTWAPRAIRDLEKICEYIAQDSVHYSRMVAQEIVALVLTIPENPLQGWMVPEYDREDIRERLVYNYRIVYRLREDLVEIVTITHGARPLSKRPPR